LKIILTSILLAFTINVSAQSNFYKLSLGGGAGLTKTFTDIEERNYGEAIYGTADFLFTPFVSLGFEIQNGTLKGGQSDFDSRARRFKNKYRSLSAIGRVSLGQFVNYNRSFILDQFKGFYVGAGVGAIQNRVVELHRSASLPPQVFIPFTKDLFIPLNVGLNYFIPNKNGYYKYVANINYQNNISLGEGLDGYDFSTLTHENGRPDMFSFITIGVKYNFGLIGRSEKTFKRY
jgi:hypothetical protein